MTKLTPLARSSKCLIDCPKCSVPIILHIMIENLKILNFKSYQDLFIELKRLPIINPMLNSSEMCWCWHTRVIKSQATRHMRLSIITKSSGGRREPMDHHKSVLLSKMKRIKKAHKKLSTKTKINNRLINKTGQIN